MGDVRPYILLGRELQNRGHQVKLTAFEDFDEPVTQAGLLFAPIKGSVTQYMSAIMQPGTNGFNYLQRLEFCLKNVVKTLPADLMDACRDAEAIVCTYFGSMMYSIAEKNCIPCIQTHYFPMDGNAHYPISSAPNIRLGKVWNRTTYRIGYLMISTLERRYLKDWRLEQGVDIRRISSRPNYEVCGHVVPVLYAMSPLVLPRPSTWGEHIRMTGYWTDTYQAPYTPSPELESFLNKTPQPVYIGFGSMVSGDMGNTLQIVMDGIREAGIRAVLMKDWGGADVQPMQDVYIGDYIPHDWLFNKVSAVVHHGGAGTTAASLRAGRPTLVIPFGGDQFFWGRRVNALGCGPKPIGRTHLTAEKLAKALLDLLGNGAYRVAAGELGMRLTKEDGTANAADIIEEEIRKWH